MANIEQLRSMTAWDVTEIVGTILATIAPGFLIIFWYKPTLFETIDSLKLFALSASITIPVISFNAFIMAVIGSFFGSIGKINSSTRKHVIFWLNIWTSVALYLCIMLAYLFHLSFHCFMLVMDLADVIVGIVSLVIMRFIVQPMPE
jgi:hypothetical protein